MRVLIGCEQSGVVRRAFRDMGHYAWSCDLEPAADGSLYHIQGDVLSVIGQGWDLAIFHPPCTFLALCQAWRRKPSKADALLYGLDPNDTVWRLQQRDKAIKFATALWNAPIPRICIENPKSLLTTHMAPKSQTIHPWEFGHGEMKETWLWLKNLPPLKPTDIVEGREQRIWKMGPTKNKADRARLRSVTYEGIGRAMAEQWGDL